MSDDAAEKILPASPERKKKARDGGDVPNSNEANTAAAMVGFLLALFACVPFVDELAAQLRIFFLHPEDAGKSMIFGDMTVRQVRAAMAFVLPLAMVPAVFVLISLAVQQAIVVAPKRIQPKLDKISPVKNAGKKFGPQALLEFAKNAAKIMVLTIVGGVLIARETQMIGQGFELSPAVLPRLLLRELVIFFALSAVVGAFFAMLDVPLVRAQLEKRLRMSQKEVKDEQKEAEGDGQLKGQRRQMAQSIAMNRMMEDVQTADVLLVNPTHYAVALKWDRVGEDLPRCVAKGVDEVALRLRAAAHEANVPIREDAPNARSLYAMVDVGEAIKPDHFAAVAAAIRFADRARSRR